MLVQNVGPFCRADIWSSLQLTSERLITVWPRKESMDFPLGRMPAGDIVDSSLILANNERDFSLSIIV